MSGSSGVAERRVAAAAAFAVGVLQLTSFALTEAGLDPSGLDGVPQALSGGAAAVARWVSAGGWSLPWFVGAVLLACADLRRGAAVIATIGALTIAGTATTFARGWPGTLAVVTLAVAALSVVTAALATSRRGRFDHGRREQATHRLGSGWYVAAAVLAWLPSVLATTAFAPPGAPRRFVELSAGGADGLVAAVVPGVVAAMILWAAPRVHPGVGGAVALTYALPALAAGVPAALAVARLPDVIFTPTGVLGPVGLSVVALLGATDLRHDVDVGG